MHQFYGDPIVDDQAGRLKRRIRGATPRSQRTLRP
jgi:hypothetical protein